MDPSRRSRHDVVVVGARAAGGATALLLARLGHDVAVVDRALFPSDTVSTHSIARGGVVQLSRWGLLDAVLDSGAPAVRQVTFNVAGETVTRTIKDTAGVDHLVAPRRHMLDTIVACAARRAGADVRLGVTVAGVLRDDGRVIGVCGHDRAGTAVELHARIVVGADGLRSRVARSVAAPVIAARGDAGATHYAYYAGLPWNGIEFFVSERSLAGVFPTHNGEACIWVCCPSGAAAAARRRAGSRAQAFSALLSRAAPALADRLRHATRTSAVAGMLRMPNQVRRAAGPGWALVGDAGYHRDAVTGYGITDAYRDAELVAVAIDRALRGDTDDGTALAEYGRQRDRALREIFDVTCALAAYPSVPEFVELQKRLRAAIETEAAALAARPIPGERRLATV
jgi:flavin-dependent dehydrogenase